MTAGARRVLGAGGWRQGGEASGMRGRARPSAPVRGCKLPDWLSCDLQLHPSHFNLLYMRKMHLRIVFFWDR